MRFAFLFLSIASLLLLSIFSIMFFYRSIRNEAIDTMQTKNDIFEVLKDAKLAELNGFNTTLVNDRAVTVPLNLNIRHKLSQYIKEIVEREQKYHICIINAEKEVYVDVGLEDSVLTKDGRLFGVDEHRLFDLLKEGKSVLSAMLLTTQGDMKQPALVSAIPVFRDGQFIGGICLYYILRDNPDMMNDFKNVLDVETLFYYNFEPVISTVVLDIDRRAYIDNTFISSEREISFSFSQGINTYIPVIDFKFESVGVVRLYQAPNKYIQMFMTAIVVYAIIAAIIIGISIFAVVSVSNSILNPLKTLLGGVNRIKEGDLAFEIMLSVKDEIGTLGEAFNDMRISLNEKIQTIENLNKGLEEKVEERTHTINELNKQMKHYLSPQLYNSIVFGQRDSSRKRYFRKKLTVFFSDVVGFTQITEMMEPEDISKLLNSYLDEMTSIALKHEGTIDKFVGDAVMVFFGDPEFIDDKVHALRAVRMGLEMQERLAELRIQWEKEGILNPFHVRMGINTGYCTIGNFGAETKMDYTIIGNNVNLASRFEQMAKPDTILISPDTFSLVKDEIVCKFIGENTFKGVTHPIKVYRPIKVKDHTIDIDYIKVSRKKIMLRDQLILPDDIDDVEKGKLVKELKKALFVMIKKPK